MNVTEIKKSGLLELYVMGCLEEQEEQYIETAISLHPELKEEISQVEAALEFYAKANAVEVSPTVKPMLLATVNYLERIEGGEAVSNPPPLSANSKISDYAFWLDQAHLQEPEAYESMHGFIIGNSVERATLIVWLCEGAPPEVHTDEIEKFLIVEGTCKITIGEEEHSLKQGDFLEIPLFVNHYVEVTSTTRCKVILERAKVQID